VTVVPLPSITSFVANPTVVSSGSSATLTAVFSGGTGIVDRGIGTVTSGSATSPGPIRASTTYTLTVTNIFVGSTMAQVTLRGHLRSLGHEAATPVHRPGGLLYRLRPRKLAAYREAFLTLLRER
jgi:hypothetical protein